MPGLPKFTLAEAETIRQRAAAGETRAAIASSCGVTQRCIANIVCGRSYTGRSKKHYRGRHDAEITRLFHADLATMEIARQLGIGEQAVRRAAIRLNLSRSPAKAAEIKQAAYRQWRAEHPEFKPRRPVWPDCPPEWAHAYKTLRMDYPAPMARRMIERELARQAA